MKKLLSVLLVCILAIVISSCGSDKLTGVWENGSGSTLDFNKDEIVWTINMFGVETSTNYEYEAKDGEITIYEDSVAITGTYSIDGDELTITGTIVLDGTWTKG